MDLTPYQFANGFYQVTSTCAYCGEVFKGWACANYSRYCPACRYMIQRECEYNEWLYAPPTFWPYMEGNRELGR